MSKQLSFLILVSLVLIGCGGDGKKGDDFSGTPGIYVPPASSSSSVASSASSSAASSEAPRPPADAPVIKTSGSSILDATEAPFLMRGINLQYGDNPSTRLQGVAPVAEVGSNIIRLQLRETTTADQLRSALDAIMAEGMVAMVLLWEEEGKITCTPESDYLLEAVQDLWLGEWLPVLAEAKYQPYLMINIANEWGPMNLFNAASTGYDSYITTYEGIIADFREAGFKVPLVIDAPHCGQDYHAFRNGRGQALIDADPEANIVLSAHAYSTWWDTPAEVAAAIDALEEGGYPFVIGEFGGSGYQSPDDVDHLDLMKQARTDGALAFDLPWIGATDKVLWRKVLSAPIDLTGTVVSARIYIPQAYVDDANLYLKLFVKDSSWTYAGFSAVSAASLTGDAWNTVRFPVNNDDDFVTGGFDLTAVDKLGVEIAANGKLAGVEGAILVDDFTVENAVVSDGFATDIANWEYDFSEGTLTQVNSVAAYSAAQGEGAMAFDLPWGGLTDKLSYRRVGVSPAVDLTGATIRMRVYVPAAYVADGNMGIKIITKDTAWVYGSLGWNSTAGMQGDAWNTIEVSNISASSFDFTDTNYDLTQVDKFGVEFVANNKPTSVTGIIYVDNFEVIPADSVLAENAFSSSNDGWEYDYSESLTEAEVTAEGVVAFSTEQGTNAFSWISWSWKGNGGDALILDMSESESAADELTDRGEEIVNGEDGLRETSVLANFPE